MDFNLPEPSAISINIYNVTGQKVKSIREDILPAGNNTISWNGMDDNGKAVSSGMYLFKMQAGKYSSTKKMILMK